MNPKQAEKLEDWVRRYGLDRLKESCDVFAQKGVPEFDKMLNGCKTHYERETGEPQPPMRYATNGHVTAVAKPPRFASAKPANRAGATVMCPCGSIYAAIIPQCNLCGRATPGTKETA